MWHCKIPPPPGRPPRSIRPAPVCRVANNSEPVQSIADPYRSDTRPSRRDHWSDRCPPARVATEMRWDPGTTLSLCSGNKYRRRSVSPTDDVDGHVLIQQLRQPQSLLCCCLHCNHRIRRCFVVLAGQPPAASWAFASDLWCCCLLNSDSRWPWQKQANMRGTV